MPKSSTCCAQWSVLVTGWSYSRMKLKKADREQLSRCASAGCANVLLAKLNARSLIDCLSAIRRQ